VGPAAVTTFAARRRWRATLGDAIGRTDSGHHCLAVIVGVDVADGRPLGGNTGPENDHLIMV
jgi:hypothetical protein